MRNHLHPGLQAPDGNGQLTAFYHFEPDLTIFATFVMQNSDYAPGSHSPNH